MIGSSSRRGSASHGHRTSSRARRPGTSASLCGWLLASAAIGALAWANAGTAYAASPEEFESLKRAFERQQDEIRQQREKLERQERALEEQRKRLEAIEREQVRSTEQSAPAVEPVVFRPPFGALYPFPPHGDLYVPAQGAGTGAGQTQQPVGEAPQQRRPDVPVIPERGGVLTPGGSLVVEPSIEWTHSDVNRFTFQGVEIIDTVLIGVIESQQADRDILTAALGLRYGITDRLEAEVKVPYVYRTDSNTTQVVEADSTSVTQDVEGHNIGDVEAAIHYQINRGQDGWPFFVANLRVKSDTGTGPFDVDRNASGIEKELATGSGFWSVEPSFTMVFPTDPAVLFANVGYLYNFSKDVDTMIGGSTVGKVEPGGAIRMAFGIGYALNEKTSLSFGYQHDFIDGTRVTIDGVETKSVELDVGALSIGFSYQFTPSWGLNTTIKVGATDDAPDVSLLVRMPILFNLL